MSAVVCLTTIGSRREAEKVARHLVREKVAACVNVIPGAVSFYHWKRKLRRDREALLVIKTSAGKLTACEREIRKTHPYELPEFIALPIVRGSPRYLRWVKDCLK